jgi:hypothetical protein
MLEVIDRAPDISPDWLTRALGQAGCLGEGKVASLDFKIIGHGKMGDNARFSLTYEGDRGTAPDTLIGKFPATDETARQMAGARGAYYNEVMFYRHLADKTTMRTPLIYANEITDDRLQFVTLMEDMAPAEPGSQLVGESLEHARVALREAARLAAAFYGDQSIGGHDYVLTAARDDGGAFGQSLLQQYWPGFLQRFGHGMTEECREFGARYVDRFTVFTNRFKGLKTLSHGDFRSENILFHGGEACTVDWQTLGETSPLADLAYFMGGSLEVADRRDWERDLVREFSEELATLGVSLGFEECWQQYREQAMHGLIITILGASFSEPAERSDAMFLAMIQRHLQHCVDLDAGDFLV